MTNKTLYGVVNGQSIELTADPGLPMGRHVEVIVTPVPSNVAWGEGIRRCAGAMASEWSEEDDQILDQIYRERHEDRLGVVE